MSLGFRVEHENPFMDVAIGDCSECVIKGQERSRATRKRETVWRTIVDISPLLQY